MCLTIRSALIQENQHAAQLVEGGESIFLEAAINT